MGLIFRIMQGKSIPVSFCKQSLKYTVRHQYVFLKALPPVCMKYTAQGESPLASIAQGKAASAIFVMRLSPRAGYFNKNEVAVLYVFYCILHLKMC